MFGRKGEEHILKTLLEESQRVLKLVNEKDFLAKYNQNNYSQIYNEIVQNINATFSIIEDSQKDIVTHFELVTKSIKVGLWDMNVVGGDSVNHNNEFIWNDDFRKMLGFKDETDFPNILDSWASRIHPHDKENILNAFNSHLMDYSGQTPYDVEHQLQMKDGEYRWFRATGTTIRSKEGIPLRFAGALYDIHYKKIKEQELQFLLTRFELINYALTEGPWDMTVIAGDLLNPNNELWWSPQFRKLLGYHDEKDFPNVLSSWSNILHPEEKERVINAFAEHLNDHSGKTPYSLDYRMLLKNGEYRWFHATGETIRDNNGLPLRVAGTIRDITIEKNKEEVEKEITFRMQQLFECIHQMVESINSVTNQAQELTTAQEKSAQAAQEAQNTANNTKKITDIIREIASQTNLLGLNAAIEAARAGEQVKGFAVVSEEVRKLSLNSANAVNDIEKSLKSMVNMVEQILQNIGEMNILTQSQASMTEEVNASVEEISSMAEDLIAFAKEV